VAISSLFLSGWEYNRVLFEDPFKAHSSGLPAQVLWNGSSQFWLFEKVYCTKEALDGDFAGYEALDWSTGRIFKDLERRGFLEAVDISERSTKDQLLKHDLAAAHAQLRELHSEDSILGLLEEGNDEKLELIKCDLLSPVFEHLNCVKNISPNSIRHWMDNTITEESKETDDGKLIKRLIDPIAKSIEPLRVGSPLCRPPGSGLPEEHLRRQREIEQTVQRPLIPLLLSGQLPNEEYLKALEPTADVYKSINGQLWNDYEQNIGRLERVRDAAKDHLWPNLHANWLPELKDRPQFENEFKDILRDAILHAKFKNLDLETLTNIGITGISGGIGLLSGLLASVAGADMHVSTGVVGTATLAVRAQLVSSYKKRLEAARPLIAFYQKLNGG
jgi:hypothetical protein